MSKALKSAIEANDPVAVRAALKTVKDLRRKLPKAEAPLAYAAKFGADAVISALLEAGAPMPDTGYEGNHPFAVAAEADHPKVVAALAAHNIPDKVIQHALFTAVLSGKQEVVRTILENCRPVVPQRVLSVSTWWKDGRIFKLLLDHGVDIETRNDGKNNHDQLEETALHDAAGSGHVDQLRLLLTLGANVNASAANGRTPLMELAASMPRLDQDLRIRKENERRVPTRAQKELQEKIAAQTNRYGDREPSDGMACARLLLEFGAEADRTDRFGNDALMYYQWECRRDGEEPNEEFIALLKQAGAKGGGATEDLFAAVRENDLAAARSAISAGANVNQDGPPPVSCTPLVMARSSDMVALLLKAGADANKASLRTTPLISAAGSGEMEIVKMLIKAGADIHALEPRAPGSEYVANAYSAADMNRKYEVAEYLKSLGAGKPVLKDWKPLAAGVGIWENFSEVIVRGEVEAVAAAVAKLIGGSVTPDVYGQSLLPGKKTYVVLRPTGMVWCNLLQVTPQRRLLDSPDSKFLSQLSKTAKEPVILAEYSDAAGAAQIERFEPDGNSQKDDGWDQPTLEEIVGELGIKAPAWMKKRLAAMKRSPEEEPDSSQRLSSLAEEEQFAIAWGGLDAEPGRKVEISFTNLPAEAFDAVAWVTSN